MAEYVPYLRQKALKYRPLGVAADGRGYYRGRRPCSPTLRLPLGTVRPKWTATITAWKRLARGFRVYGLGFRV